MREGVGGVGGTTLQQRERIPHTPVCIIFISSLLLPWFCSSYPWISPVLILLFTSAFTLSSFVVSAVSCPRETEGKSFREERESESARRVGESGESAGREWGEQRREKGTRKPGKCVLLLEKWKRGRDGGAKGVGGGGGGGRLGGGGAR